jgi:hypothetical protein
VPTDNYDVRLERHGIDLLQGLGANRDAAAHEEVAIIYASTSLHPAVDEDDELTFVIDNHFAPSAQITAHLFYALGA